MPEQGMDKKRCFIITPIGNDNDSTVVTLMEL